MRKNTTNLKNYWQQAYKGVLVIISAPTKKKIQIKQWKMGTEHKQVIQKQIQMTNMLAYKCFAGTEGKNIPYSPRGLKDQLYGDL